MRGYDGAVYVGTDKVLRVLEFSYQRSADADWSKHKQAAATVKAGGHVTGSGTITCEWDPANTTGQGALTSGAAVTLNLYPEPSGLAGIPAAGNVVLSGAAVISSKGINSPQTGFDRKTFSFEGVLTQSTVGS